MGIYLNPEGVDFQRAMDEDIYIDKSNLISYTNDRINKAMRYLCVSRPRRFGKSMAADMLVAYYSRGCDSSEWFAGLKIAQDGSYRAHLNQHNVIRFDVQQFLFRKSDLGGFIDEIQGAIIKELRKEYGECFEAASLKLPDVLRQIYAHTKKGFVFIIDEWDSVFRLAKEHEEAQKEYLDFLRWLFKGAEYVELAYMTGILPIKKYGEHSAINMFKEISMLNPGRLAECFGFTEAEVQALCVQYGIDYGEAQKWYDGYLLDGKHIYNPHAVVGLMDNRKFQSYWTGTETYEALKVYIEQDFDGLREVVATMLGNGRCQIDPATFLNDMTTFKGKDDVLTLLVHLGYLAYDDATSEVFIPNQEVAQEFMRAIKVGGWGGIIKALNRSDQLLKDTWGLDGDAVAKGIAAIHNETTSMLKYNNENSLACALYIAYYSAKAYYANPIHEMPSGKGFADVVYLPLQNTSRPALVVELKWDKSARGAIQQIKDRQYTDWVKGYTGDILLVGINYDTDTKEHECVIERCAKE